MMNSCDATSYKLTIK